MTDDYTCPACLRTYRECACARWCNICRCTTNHTTKQHEVMQEFTRKEG